MILNVSLLYLILNLGLYVVELESINLLCYVATIINRVVSTLECQNIANTYYLFMNNIKDIIIIASHHVIM